MFYHNTKTTGHEHQPKRDGRWLLAFQTFKFLTLALHENFLRSKFKYVKTRSIKGFGILGKMRHNKSEIQILKILYDFLFGSHHRDGHIFGDNGIMTSKIFFSVLLKASISAFRVLFTILLHFAWMSKQNYNFSCSICYIFSNFSILNFSWSSVKST